MRTIVRVNVDPKRIQPRSGIQVEDAAAELLAELLRDARIISPASNPILNADTIRRAFKELRSRALKKGMLPSDPEDALIWRVANEVLESAPGQDDGFEHDHELRVQALRHALSILAQIPVEDHVDHSLNVVHLLFDRDAHIFGLMSQTGMNFTFRLRFRNIESLKGATERLVDTIAPRPEGHIDDVVARVDAVSRVRERFDLDYLHIEMKTPKGEPAQTGRVHTVTSQLSLLAYLARETPQLYLVYITGLFLVGAWLLQTNLVPAMELLGLSMSEWVGDLLARLATGAFGAYLVTLFLRFGELRSKLKSAGTTGKRRRGRAAYGAFIEWRPE